MEKAIVTGPKGFIAKNLLKEIENQFYILTIDEDIFRRHFSQLYDISTRCEYCNWWIQI